MYLERRRRRWYALHDLSRDVGKALGRKRLVKSLETQNKWLAKRRAALLWVQWQREIEEARHSETKESLMPKLAKNTISERVFTKTAQGYRFTAKDPVIEFCLSQWKKSGISLHRMAVLSNLSPSTIRNWDEGKTIRPQHVSVSWFLNALGVKLVAINNEGIHYNLRVLDRPPNPKD